MTAPRWVRYLAVAACGTLFGVIHSPLEGSPVFWPWQLAGEPLEWVVRFSIGYVLAALTLLLFHAYARVAPGPFAIHPPD